MTNANTVAAHSHSSLAITCIVVAQIVLTAIKAWYTLVTKRLSIFRRQKSIAYVEQTGDNVASATMSQVWTDGRQRQNFMNINDSPDLCLGLLPQMTVGYFFHVITGSG